MRGEAVEYLVPADRESVGVVRQFRNMIRESASIVLESTKDAREYQRSRDLKSFELKYV